MPPAPIHIESPWVAVEFDDSAGFSGTIDDFFDVHLIGVALEKEPSGEVAKHGDVFIFHGANKALGHGFFIEGEGVVNGSDTIVELAEDFIAEVERAIFENIDLGAG